MTCDLVTTNPVFAGDEQPYGKHPLIHTERRVLEDAADLNGELLFAALTKPYTASADERVLLRSAAWAFYAIRPTKNHGPSMRLLGVAEVKNCFL
jgi:hypothetical protein